MKKIYSITKSCFLIFIISLTSGCLSTGLVNSGRCADPYLTEIHGAYQKENSLLLDYSVGKASGVRCRIGPARYWATVALDGIDRYGRGDYNIRRSQLRGERPTGWSPISVINLNDRIELNHEKAYQSQQAAAAFIGTIPNEDLPIVAILAQEEKPWTGFFAIVFVNPETGARQTWKKPPRSSYIPLKNYPRIIALFPFAIIGDILSAPLLLGVPRIDG